MTTVRNESQFELGGLLDTLDSLQEGIQILSPEWRYLYVNEAVARHGRKRREELLGKSMLECYSGIEHTLMFSVLERCLREQRAENLENEFRYEDGQRGWFELRVRPCRQGLIVLSLDISERKRLELELREGYKLRALGRMAAGVVHDLKNILNPIGFGVHLIRRRLTTDQAATSEMLSDIEEALRTGNDLLERLRSFSRQEPERAAESTDLNGVADVALEICLPLIHARAGVQFRRVRGEVPPVLLHRSETISAIVNLLINALDALPAKGTITVRTGADDGGWIEVMDDGPGMPPEIARRVFEPFFTTKTQGTGLGLAQVYALVQRHAGRITLDTAPGQGTTLRMWFPGIAAPLRMDA